jgi:hypothetical protein
VAPQPRGRQGQQPLCHRGAAPRTVPHHHGTASPTGGRAVLRHTTTTSLPHSWSTLSKRTIIFCTNPARLSVTEPHHSPWCTVSILRARAPRSHHSTTCARTTCRSCGPSHSSRMHPVEPSSSSCTAAFLLSVMFGLLRPFASLARATPLRSSTARAGAALCL